MSPLLAPSVTSLRCNDLSAFGTKRTRHERQRIAGVPFSPGLRPSLTTGGVLPFSNSWIRFLGRLVGEESPPTDMRAAKAHRHSELEANLLMPQRAENDDFSEYALIQQTNSADFDSAIPRFESWRPSQLILFRLSRFRLRDFWRSRERSREFFVHLLCFVLI